MKLARLHAPAALLLVTAALLAFWLLTDTPETHIAGYVATWLWLVALPGWVLARLLLGRCDSVLEELAFGVTLGMSVGTLLWLLLTSLGVNQVFVLWPLPVLVWGVVVHRRNKRAFAPRHALPETPTRRRGLGPTTIWLTAAAAMIILTTAGRRLFAISPLPPGEMRWFQDDYWQLALTAQVQHSIPPDLPQVAGTTFWYHWFANAHIASLASTGIDLNTVMMRLWMPAALLAVLAMSVTVGKQLTGAYWPGALAAVLTAHGAAILPAWFGLSGVEPSNVNSPSQQFSLAIILLAVSMLVTLLTRRRLSPGQWGVLVIALFAVSGAKGSVLPVLICGMLAVTALCLLTLRSHLKAALQGLIATIAVLAVGMPLTSGGSAGVHLQLFSSIKLLTPWQLMLGDSPISLEPVLPGLDRAGAPLLLALLLLSYLVAFGYVWTSIPRWRANPAVWLLLSMGVAGWSAMMLVNQDGQSQIYFFSGAVMGWHLLAGVGAHWAWRRSTTAHGITSSVGAVLFGAAVGASALLATSQLGQLPIDPTVINRTLVVALGVWLALCLIVLLVAWLWRAGRAGVWLGFVAGQIGAAVPVTRLLHDEVAQHDAVRVGYAVVALLGAALLVFRARSGVRRSAVVLAPALALVLAVGLAAEGVRVVRDAAAEPVEVSVSTVTRAESTATLWLRDHSDPSDIVATNLHCAVKKTTPECDARLFWVGAFTQRLVLVEGWGYTAEAHEAHGVNGLPFARQPFHDQELFELNEAAFYDPSPEVMDALRDRGVVWLFADKYAGAFSDDLSEYAELVHENSDVHIYRLN